MSITVHKQVKQVRALEGLAISLSPRDAYIVALILGAGGIKQAIAQKLGEESPRGKRTIPEVQTPPILEAEFVKVSEAAYLAIMEALNVES